MHPLRNKAILYSKLLAPRPTPKLEDHPSSAVSDCLLRIFAATLHTGDRFSIRNLRRRHALVTGTHLSRDGVLVAGYLSRHSARLRFITSILQILFIGRLFFPSHSKIGMYGNHEHYCVIVCTTDRTKECCGVDTNYQTHT